jgi:hypothetical protein
MKVISIYAQLYGECLLKALLGIRNNLWTLLLPIGLLVALEVLTGVVASLRLGLLGGIALALIMDALISCYLYFVGEVVANSRVSLQELKRAFGAYFWSIVNLMFVIWIARFALGMLLRGPQGGLLMAAVYLVALVALNAAPEVLYQGGSYGGIQTIQRSVQFLQQNWIEWFVPNLPALFIVAVVWWFASAVSPPLLPLGSILGGALFHLVMIFRGHLFAALDGSSHRQRMFRYRTGQ